MKKLFLLMTTLFLVIGFSLSAQAVPIFQVGDLALKFNDYTYFEMPDANNDGMSDLPGVGGVVDTIPLPAGSTGGGRTWGVANVTSIHTIVGGDIEHPTVLSPIPIWVPTAGDFLQVRFGGLILDTNHATYNPAGGYPYDLYFDADTGNYDHITRGGAYMEIYSRTTDGFVQDYLDGPGTGVYGSFGLNVANLATASLWLDVDLTPGMLEAYDANAEGPMGGFPSSDWDIEKTTISTLTTGAGTIYGDVVGGSAASSFIQGLFPLNPPVGWTGPYADIQFKSNLTALYDPTTNTWNDPYGWTNESQDPVTGSTIPEPATLFLLGSGLVGIVGYGKRRIKK